MFHPFLIMPAIGGIMLTKVALSTSDRGTRYLLFIVIALIIAMIIGYILSSKVLPLNRPLIPYRPLQPAIREFRYERRVNGLDDAFRHINNLAGQLAGMGAGNAQIVIRQLDNLPILNRVPAGHANNVHDHEIQNSVIKAVVRLKRWYEDNATDTDVLAQIKEHIFNGYNGRYTVKENAYSTVRTIERVNGYMQNIDIRELDLLKIIWTRMSAPLNAEVSSALKDNLVELLADSTIRVDNPYCLTGRITRMVQALESIDAEGIVNITCTDNVKDEIAQKVPLLIENFFEDRPDDKDAYDRGSDRADSIAQELHNAVDAELRRDYLDTDILTEAKFKEIVAPYLEEIIA